MMFGESLLGMCKTFFAEKTTTSEAGNSGSVTNHQLMNDPDFTPFLEPVHWQQHGACNVETALDVHNAGVSLSHAMVEASIFPCTLASFVLLAAMARHR